MTTTDIFIIIFIILLFTLSVVLSIIDIRVRSSRKRYNLIVDETINKVKKTINYHFCKRMNNDNYCLAVEKEEVTYLVLSMIQENDTKIILKYNDNLFEFVYSIVNSEINKIKTKPTHKILFE